MKIFRIVGIAVGLGIIALLSGAAWLWFQLQPLDTSAKEPQVFVIPKGQSFAKTAQSLEEAHLIKNAQLFRYYAHFKKLDTKIQSGTYTIAANMSASQVLAKLNEGGEDLRITLLEGWRMEEMADYLAQQELPNFDKKKFIELASASEGTLFPDTYLVARESTAEQIYKLLTDTFAKKVQPLWDAYHAHPTPSDQAYQVKTLHDAVTLASIVQRESKAYPDMQHVAGILLHRIDEGIPLQVDVSLQYVNGYDAKNKTWWTPDPLQAKQSTSPFNTFAHQGLPPHAIANPGLNAIKAVLDPLITKDIFFIYSPDGKMYYGVTLNEHDQNIDQHLR